MQLLRERAERNESAVDLLSHQSQTEYFKRYYQHFASWLGYPVNGQRYVLFDLLGISQQACSDYKRAHGRVPTLAFRSSPKTIAEHFQVIENPTTSVLVPFEEGKNLIADLHGVLKPEDYAPTLKKAQQFIVNLFDYQKSELEKNGVIYPLLNGEVWAIKDSAYSDEFGLDLEALAGNSFLNY